MSIQIHGLTNKQKAICEKLWSLNTREEILLYMSQKSHKEQQEIQAMMELMLAEYIDLHSLTREDCIEANLIIENIMAK